ncbi:MAG: hypothetical protein MJA83_10165, partial [Gammaproteobacteria bacterium]|nr:hypothetical protein [Gammaproteobacteria bacterium]
MTDYLKMMAAMHKDYLTIEESAFYCGCSTSHFEKIRKNLVPKTGVHKILYKKTDLQRVIEWRQSTGGMGSPT